MATMRWPRPSRASLAELGSAKVSDVPEVARSVTTPMATAAQKESTSPRRARRVTRTAGGATSR